MVWIITETSAAPDERRPRKQTNPNRLRKTLGRHPRRGQAAPAQRSWPLRTAASTTTPSLSPLPSEHTTTTVAAAALCAALPDAPPAAGTPEEDPPPPCPPANVRPSSLRKILRFVLHGVCELGISMVFSHHGDVDGARRERTKRTLRRKKRVRHRGRDRAAPPSAAIAAPLPPPSRTRLFLSLKMRKNEVDAFRSKREITTRSERCFRVGEITRCNLWIRHRRCPPDYLHIS